MKGMILRMDKNCTCQRRTGPDKVLSGKAF